MCGIAGIATTPSGESSIAPAQLTERLRRMNSSLLHRGPDDEGCFAEGGSGLAMRRLAIVDLEDGSQPIFDEERRFVIVGNGEIYNAPELRAELFADGHRFRTGSDIEAVLHLFEEYGTACFSRLNGMFAVAILDRQDGSIHIARDRLGIKPLFYAHTPHATYFASEIPALRQGLGTADASVAALRPEALRDYLALGYVPGTQTMHEGIKRLPAGHWARISRDGTFHHEPWWNLPAYTPEDRPLDDWCDELSSLLRNSVKLRTLGDVPAGAFLSGGLDSGAILSLLADESASPVPAFTIGFGDKDLDEIEDARSSAALQGAEHHVEIVSGVTLDELDRLFSRFGEPFADVSLLPTDRVSRLAARHVKFVLSGDGGDELFAGYSWLQREVRYRQLPSSLQHGARALRPLLGSAVQSTRSNWVGKALRALGDLGTSPAQSFLRRRSLCAETQLSKLLHARIRDTWTELPETPLQRHARRWQERHPGHDFELLLDLDRRFYLGGDILEKVDRASMNHSLEARVPFLDHRIVELAARIPIATHLGPNGQGKQVLRKTIARWLPPELFQRRKRGFGIPVDRWLREPTLLRELEGRLRDPEFRRLELVDDARVGGLIEQHRSGRGRHGHVLWGLLSLATWSQQLASTPTPVAVP